MSRRPMQILLITALLAAAACSSNSLDGSENQAFSLNFTTFEAIMQQSYLLLQYNDGNTTTCKISINTSSQTIANGTEITHSAFLQNVTFTRISTDGLNYPAPFSGEITFSKYNFAVGGEVSGHFDTLFTDGHTLLGTFGGKIQAGAS